MCAGTTATVRKGRSHEVTVPLLPCAALDDVVAFYEVLGFHPTYWPAGAGGDSGDARHDRPAYTGK